MRKLAIFLALTAGVYLGAIDNNVLIVTGSGKMEIRASTADVKIGIEAEGKTSGEVQQSVNTRLKAALEQLRGAQIERLQTSVLNIYSILNPANPATVSGYRARIDISFSIPTERAPEIIERAFKAGVNQLISLNFRADDKAIALARLTALQAACANALLEAKTVMETLGLSSTKIIAVRIEPYEPIEDLVGEKFNPNAQVSTSPGVEIIQQQQTIPAAVTLTLQLNS